MPFLRIASWIVVGLVLSKNFSNIKADGNDHDDSVVRDASQSIVSLGALTEARRELIPRSSMQQLHNHLTHHIFSRQPAQRKQVNSAEKKSQFSTPPRSQVKTAQRISEAPLKGNQNHRSNAKQQLKSDSTLKKLQALERTQTSNPPIIENRGQKGSMRERTPRSRSSTVASMLHKTTQPQSSSSSSVGSQGTAANKLRPRHWQQSHMQAGATTRECLSLVYGLLSPPFKNALQLRNGNYSFLTDNGVISSICRVNLKGKYSCSHVREFPPAPAFLTKYEIKHVANICEQTWAAHSIYNRLKDAIENRMPFMMGKLGQTEYAHVVHWHKANKGRREFEIWPVLYEVAGVYPLTQKAISKFAELYFNSSQQLDVVVRWTDDMREDDVFHNMLFGIKPQNSNNNTLSVNWVQGLWPWYWQHPYTELFVDKTVLVVSPFEPYIQAQYNNNRECIFPNTTALPRFKLKTYLAPLPPMVDGKRDRASYANPATFNHTSWFQVFEEMKNRISKIEYDIMVVGAGAFGLPLAAAAKLAGKVAVILGGNLGPLFGLKGGRFDRRDIYNKYFYNSCWVRMEKPPQAQQMESSAYW